MAERLAAQGYRVGVTGRREALLAELAASNPGGFCYAAADIADPAASCAALERLVSCLRGGGAAPAYNASKAYQINYAEGLRQRAAKSSRTVCVTDIRPGFVATAMAKGEGLFWVMPAGKAADQIVRAIRRRPPVAVVTRRWRLLAWVLKHLPECIYRKMG